MWACALVQRKVVHFIGKQADFQMHSLFLQSPKILWHCPLSEKSRLCLYVQISFKGFGLIWDRRMDQDHLTAECLPFQKGYGVNLNNDITFLLKVAQHIDLHGYQNVSWPHWIGFCCTNKQSQDFMWRCMPYFCSMSCPSWLHSLC